MSTASKVITTPTTPPPAGDVAALRALSEKATQGEWAIDHIGPEENGYVFLKCTGAKRGGSDRTVSWHQMARFVVETDGKPSETGRANVDLAVALVNAYRSGELVHRTHVLPAQTTTAAAPGSESGVEAAVEALKLVDSFEQSGSTLLCPEQYPPGYAQGWKEAHAHCAKDLRALARRPAPATGGAARLDREAVARLDSALGSIGFVDEPLAYHIKHGLAVKLASALDPAPQSHAASEGVREAAAPVALSDLNSAVAGISQTWNGREDERDRAFEALVDAADALNAAITPAGRGADAGGKYRSLEAEEKEARQIGDPRVDSQVWAVARCLNDDAKEQPEWLWYDEGKTSLGRWKKSPEAAPYVRADIALDMFSAAPTAQGEA